MSEYVGLRGRAWFKALTGNDQPRTGDPGSVLTADAQAGCETAVFLCVVPNPDSRFPCVRDGQVGLEEAYALATRIREAIDDDRDRPKAEKHPIIAIIDVKSQAYGRREETAGIFLAAAAAADAYALARMAGHPVISLVAGPRVFRRLFDPRLSSKSNPRIRRFGSDNPRYAQRGRRANHPPFRLRLGALGTPNCSDVIRRSGLCKTRHSSQVASRKQSH